MRRGYRLLPPGEWRLAVMAVIFLALSGTAGVSPAAPLPPGVAQAGGRGSLAQVVEGVKVTLLPMGMKEWLKGRPFPRGMRETHHLLVSFQDATSGRALNQGVAKAKVFAPDNSEQVKELEDMGWHFGEDFDLSRKGSYEIVIRFRLKDGKVRTARFRYEIR